MEGSTRPGVVRRTLRWLRAALMGFGGEPTVILCAVPALLIVSHYQGNTGYYRTILGDRLDAAPYAPALGHFWWFGMSLCLYFVTPLLLAYATKGSFFRRYGLGLGDWKAGLGLTALLLTVMLPATWYASTLESFRGIYPLAGQAAYKLAIDGQQVVSLELFLAYELGYFAYFIGWEFLYRGWMLNGLMKHYGKAGAILIQTVPFAIMHLGKAELEALGSIVAGLALGLLALRTRSFWYGALLHGVVAVWMDWLAAKSALFPPSP